MTFFPEDFASIDERKAKPGESIVVVGRKVALSGTFEYINVDGKQVPGIRVTEVAVKLNSPALIGVDGDVLEVPVKVEFKNGAFSMQAVYEG